jgi:hypothetical protein
MARSNTRTTTDHEEIRRWAEARDARPACVRGTGRGGDTGMIRLDFPGYTGSDKLQEISWDEWFRSFDDNNLALVYQERTAEGEESNFNKLVGRETAGARARSTKSSGSRRGSASRRSTSSRRSSAGRRSASARKSTSRTKPAARGRNRGNARKSARGRRSGP